MGTLNMLNFRYAVLELSKCTEYGLYIGWKFAGGKAPAQVALPKPRSKSSLRLIVGQRTYVSTGSKSARTKSEYFKGFLKLCVVLVQKRQN